MYDAFTWFCLALVVIGIFGGLLRFLDFLQDIGDTLGVRIRRHRR